jgi:hypothetical protein
VLELVEEPLDEVALAIEGEIGRSRLFAVCLRRDDRRDLAPSEGFEERVGVIRLVGDQSLGLEVFEQRFGLADVGGLPRRQRQRDRIAERIDDSMDLRRQAAARAADGLVFAAFF